MKLYKQQKGKSWRMRFVFEGERIDETTGFTNLRKAEAYAEAFRVRLRNEGIGILEKKPAPSFKKAMTGFLEWSATWQKESTASRYKVASVALLAFFGRVSRVDRITKPQIEKFIPWRKMQYGAPRGVKPKTGKPKQTKKRKISNATINRELACLKKMFSNMVADGIVAGNPVKLVKFLDEDSEPGRVLNRDEEATYLAKASKTLNDYVTVLVETGMRPDELCRLAVQDVFLQPERPYLKVIKGKTKAARRTIPLSRRAVAVLQKRIASAEGMYIFAGGRGGKDPNKPALKFNNAHSGARDRSKVDGINRTGTIGVCTLYSFRHTFATRFLERRPGDLLTLAALLGHSSLRMVMRYAHPSDEHKFEAIRSMEDPEPSPQKPFKNPDEDFTGS